MPHYEHRAIALAARSGVVPEAESAAAASDELVDVAEVEPVATELQAVPAALGAPPALVVAAPAVAEQACSPAAARVWSSAGPAASLDDWAEQVVPAVAVWVELPDLAG